MKEKEKKKLKKAILIIAVIAILINLILSIFFNNSFSEDDGVDSITYVFKGLSNIVSVEDNVLDNSNSSTTIVSSTSEDDSSDSLSYSYEVTNDSQSVLTGYASRDIGKMTIEYNVDMASTATGTAQGCDVDILYFNDGNENDLKGAVIAIESFVGLYDQSLSSVEDAQTVVTEYIHTGGTGDEEWEECNDYFVRKYIAYDTMSSASYLYYMVVPKNSSIDTFVYYTVFIMDEDPDDAFSGIMISEESYETVIFHLKELVPDCSYFDLSYDDAYDELFEVLYWETANGSGVMDGIQQLKAAALISHLDDIYGDYMRETGKTYDELTDEEKDELEQAYEEAQNLEDEEAEE